MIKEQTVVLPDSIINTTARQKEVSSILPLNAEPLFMYEQPKYSFVAYGVMPKPYQGTTTAR